VTTIPASQENTMTLTPYGLETLSVGALDARSRLVESWSDEFEDRLSYVEAFECEHEDDNGTTTYHLLNAGGFTYAVRHGESLYSRETGGDDQLPDGLLEQLLEVEPYEHGSEGPVMNFLWPVEHARVTPADAAYNLRDLPLCVVVDGYDENEIVGLALTGGGMDLSWEIAQAYISIGFLPPLALLDLPNMAGPHPAWKRDVVAAYRRGLAWMIENCQSRLTRLDDTEASL
jgi:hypothetical protein